MRILFLTHPYPNYVPDLLLHGLRKLFGPDVVDFPRKDCLYNGVLGLGVCPPNQLCPGWFPEDRGQIDREDIAAKIQRGYFTYIVSDIRAAGSWMEAIERSRSLAAIIDGEDRPTRFQAGRYVIFRRETDGSDYSVPLPMALPEEIFSWITAYDSLPKKYTLGFLGSTHDGKRKEFLEHLQRWFPDSLFSASIVPSDNHPFPDGRYGRDAYYRELQQCRFVLSLAGAGLDTFRFWENAACNAVHLAPRFRLFIPDDFVTGHGIVRFSNLDQLKASVERIAGANGDSEEIIVNGRLNLIRCHFTTARARYLLDRLHQASGR
jgi:hypothetical protein